MCLLAPGINDKESLLSKMSTDDTPHAVSDTRQKMKVICSQGRHAGILSNQGDKCQVYILHSCIGKSIAGNLYAVMDHVGPSQQIYGRENQR